MTSSLGNNKLIAEALQEVSELRFKEGNVRSGVQHKKAAKTISSLNYEITSGAHARQIRGIGPKIGAKIDEILERGKLEILEMVSVEEKEARKVIVNFKRIWGVGENTAEDWYKMGYRKLEDLPLLLLNTQQRLGLIHLKDLEKTTSRMDAKEIGAIINSDVQHLVKGTYEAVIVGSYRRGKPTSKDVDILLHPVKAGVEEPDIIRWVIQERCPDVRVLSMGADRFTGLVRIRPNDPWRHLDIWASTYEEIPFALLAHTGPANTNIELRKVAIRKGWKLNEKGLFDAKGKRVTTPIRKEADIYKTLGVKYVAPKDRK